jgi:hypothetical protein
MSCTEALKGVNYGLVYAAGLQPAQLFLDFRQAAKQMRPSFSVAPCGKGDNRCRITCMPADAPTDFGAELHQLVRDLFEREVPPEAQPAIRFHESKGGQRIWN